VQLSVSCTVPDVEVAIGMFDIPRCARCARCGVIGCPFPYSPKMVQRDRNWEEHDRLPVQHSVFVSDWCIICSSWNYSIHYLPPVDPGLTACRV
jgi:hypothetical protein